jgi:hypothetical protein
LLRCGTATFAPAAPAPRPSLRNQFSSSGLWPVACCIAPEFPSLPPWLGSGLLGSGLYRLGSLRRLSPGSPGSWGGVGVRGQRTPLPYPPHPTPLRCMSVSDLKTHLPAQPPQGDRETGIWHGADAAMHVREERTPGGDEKHRLTCLFFFNS